MRLSCLALCLLLTAFSLRAAPAAGQALSPIAEMDSYLAQAIDAEGLNHLAEAIGDYVTVLVLANESPSPDASARADGASAELARIGSRFTLEPAGEWLDEKGAQVSGNSRDLGQESGLSPAVYLFESFGSGKSPVADAPIFFQFVKNSGSLVPLVTTDAYGRANTTIAKLEEPGSDAIIRAYPVFAARGKAYAFRSAFRDFAYLPPANIVKVFALERSELGANDAPFTIDALAAALKKAGLQVVSAGSRLGDDTFMGAYAGKTEELAALGIDKSSPYAAFALVEVAAAKQMELNGKKYNIFTAAVTASFRLLRSDGIVAYSLPLAGIKGQGSSEEAAIADAYRRARESLGSELEKRLEEIRAALKKG
jgi:hypothetical protein